MKLALSLALVTAGTAYAGPPAGLLRANATEVDYQGRPAREWIDGLRSPAVEVRRSTTASIASASPGADALIPALREAVNDKDEEVRRNAVKALITLGRYFPEAIPPLLEALNSADPKVRFGAVQGLGEITAPRVSEGPETVRLPCEAPAALLVVLNSDKDAAIRAAAAKTVAGFNSYSRKTCPLDPAPSLIKALEDKEPTVRRNVAEALGALRSETAVPALLTALHDPDQGVRDLSVLALSTIQAKPGITIPRLSEVLLHAHDEEIRRRTLEVLRGNSYFIADEARFKDTIQVDRDAFFAAVVPLLTDSDSYLARQAAAAFLDLGRAAQPAVPALVRSLEEPTGVDRRMVVRALGCIGSAEPTVVAALVEVLRTDASVRGDAAKALAALGAEAVHAATASLVEALRSEKLTSGIEGIVDGLVALGPESARGAASPLAARVGDEDPDRRVIVVASLGKLGPVAIPALLSALQDSDARVRVASVQALGKIGGSAAIPALEKARNDKDELVRYAAHTVLMTLKPDDVGIPELVDALKAEDADARFRAVTALYRLGPAAAPAVPGLIAALEDEDVNVRRVASQTLREIGTAARPAIPALIACLKRSQGIDRQSLALDLEEIGRRLRIADPALIDAVKDEDAEVRRLAIRILRRVGKSSEAAAPALREAMRDHDAAVRVEAALCLAEIGHGDQKTLQILLDALATMGDSINEEKRLGEIVGGLRRMASEAPGLADAYVRLLGHPTMAARRAAAEGLASASVATPVVVAALRKALADPDSWTRRAAALSLGDLRPASKATVPSLEGALFEDSAEVRVAAADALGKLQSVASVPALLRAMKDPDSRVRASTATALGSLGSDAQVGIDLLISATLSDSSEYVRDRAGTALWQVEPRGERVSQAMVQALRIPETRQAAAGALGKIGPRAVAAGTYLSSGLRDPTPEVAIVCARALGKMGPSAKAQVPSLIEALKSSSQSVMFNAIEALGNIGPEASEAMPALVDLTTRASEREIRDAAASALWRLGPAAVPLLLEAVADSGRRVGAQAALFRFDPEMTEVAPYLVPALDDSNYEIRRQAAMSLTRLDSPTPEAVPALIRMLADPELDFRLMASQMLGKLGPAAKTAVPALRRAEEDPSDVVGNAAREALVKIEGVPSPSR